MRNPARGWLTLLTILTACQLLLASCGFRPLLGRNNGSSQVEQLNGVQVLPVQDRSGQILRNNLIDALNPRGDRVPTSYTLEVQLAEPRQEIAIRRDETASRVSYTANTVFILRDVSGRVLFSGASSSSSTYEATNSEFASISGQRSARDRAMQEISENIRQQLASFFMRASTSKP
jgi:LPS-assembly lipoprotein